MQFLKELSSCYNEVREKRLPYRRFTTQLFYDLLKELESFDSLQIKEEGKSIEERPIYSVTLGSGESKVLVWTQMHGNESTATRAVFDFLNSLNNQTVKGIGAELLKRVQLKFIPVLNPDGLERYQRRNALNIDPNRDALKKASPEIQLLFRVVEEYNPDWCFNMHDQRNLFNVERTNEPACLSFLSPSTKDGIRGQNQKDAMMLIERLHHALNHFIPGKMGRFTHEFYPTATGDNLQSAGYRTILVESGGYRGDVERENPRKMNFLLLWEAIRLIADGTWAKGTALRYSEIPQNDQKLFDMLIRNVNFEIGGKTVVGDIGIDYTEVPATNPEGFVIKSSIRDMGDLSLHFGYDEFDATGYSCIEILQVNQVADFELKNDSSVVEVVNGKLV